MTDSEEEELSDSEHDDRERPEDKLNVLLERIDRLRQGTESDKRESLDILLEHREEVRKPPHSTFILVNNKITVTRSDLASVRAELVVSLAANASLQ